MEDDGMDVLSVLSSDSIKRVSLVLVLYACLS